MREWLEVGRWENRNCLGWWVSAFKFTKKWYWFTIPYITQYITWYNEFYQVSRQKSPTFPHISNPNSVTYTYLKTRRICNLLFYIIILQNVDLVLICRIWYIFITCFLNPVGTIIFYTVSSCPAPSPLVCCQYRGLRVSVNDMFIHVSRVY